MVSRLESVSVSLDVQFGQLRFDMATHGSQRLPVLLAVHGFNVINAEQCSKEPDGRVILKASGIEAAFELLQTLRQRVYRPLLEFQCIGYESGSPWPRTIVDVIQ